MSKSGTKSTTVDSAVDRVREILDEVTGAETEIVGIPDFVAAGADYTVYSAKLGGEDGYREVVVRMPRQQGRDGQPERGLRSVVARRRLLEQGLPFEIPRPLGTVETDAGLAVVETWMNGVELAAATTDVVDPAEVTATVAAACHSVDDPELRRELGGPVDGRDHGLEALEVFESASSPILELAREWCSDHLPAGKSTSLLHGDLLAQNMLVETGEGEPRIVVLDWDDVQYGDPALELAVVTRGYETVFGSGGSRLELLEAYERVGQREIGDEELRFWELVVLAREYKTAEGSRAKWLVERMENVIEGA